MVDHLRKVRSSSGEQGLKSKKKRRRRSHQPIREKRKRRLMLMGAFLVVILPILTFILGSFLFSYMAYKGERFRRDMSASVNETLGVQGEFEDTFSVSKLTVKNRRFSATGAPDSVLAAFDLNNLEARLKSSSFFSDIWRIPHLVADKAMLELRPLPATATQEQAMIANGPRILAAGLGFSGVPDRYQIERISCRNFNANFGINPDVPHQIENLHLTVNRTQRGYFMNADRGTLKYLYWPLFNVETADLTLYEDGKLAVHGLSLVSDEGGKCSVTGEIQLGENPSVDLFAEVTNVKVDNLVHRSWSGEAEGQGRQYLAERVLGRLNAELQIQGGLTVDQLPTISGTIKIPGLSIKNLPILTSLSVQCGIAELRRLEFPIFEMRFEQEGNKIRMFDIYGSNPELAALMGEVTIMPDRNVQGALEIGLPNSTLDAMAKDASGVDLGRPTFFKPKLSGDGTNLSWAAFTVTGDIAEPIDNLGRQFDAYLSRRSGSYNPREHSRMTTFQRPIPLYEGPTELYIERLEGLFDLFMN